jgi:hypothetical protein
MARNELIQAILEAWWQWENCEPADLATAEKKLYALLERSIASRDFTPEQVLECLSGRYREFKAARKREEKISIARSALKKGR